MDEDEIITNEQHHRHLVGVLMRAVGECNILLVSGEGNRLSLSSPHLGFLKKILSDLALREKKNVCHSL